MGLIPTSTTCATCRARFSAVPKRTFLGFQRVRCPECSAEVLYPLTNGYRITYWVLAIWMLLVVIGAFAEGQIAVPGLLGIGTVVALVRDRALRQLVVTSEQDASAR